jgi:hypothetical protein
MSSWHAVIKEFKAEKEEHNGEAATLALMYLAIKGEDSAYRMAKFFRNELIAEKGWTEDQMRYLGPLTHQSQLGTLFSRMEMSGFVRSRKKQTGRRNRFYILNEDIILYPFNDEFFQKLHDNRLKSKGIYVDGAEAKSDARAFLNELRKKDIAFYLRKWSVIEKFDFLTFLAFLSDEARELNNSYLMRIITENISTILKSEEERTKLKSRFEYFDKAVSDNESRKIYKAQTAVERIADSMKSDEQN